MSVGNSGPADRSGPITDPQCGHPWLLSRSEPISRISAISINLDMNQAVLIAAISVFLKAMSKLVLLKLVLGDDQLVN